PNYAARAGQFGMTLQSRNGRGNLRRALAVLKLATEAPTSGVESRLWAALDYARLLGHFERPTEALAVYAQCVQQFLPILVWRGLDRGSQQRHLRQVAGLASEAAAMALICERPRVAVQLLEQGRSVLWAQLLETRSDRTRLQDSFPELAAEFDKVCAVLDSRDDMGLGGLPTETAMSEAASAASETDRRRRAADRFTELRDRIRGLPGFTDFLTPPGFADLQQAASDGPVVIINVSHLRCDAIVMTADNIQVLPLPGLTEVEASRRAEVFQQACDAGAVDLGTRITATQTILATLEWLWATTAEPALRALDGHGRIWWYPTGPLAALPLHAAGLHRRGASGDWVGDHAVSSYTSTLQALLRSRTAPSAEPSDRVLAVGMASTPRPDGSHDDLPAVPAELSALTDSYGDRLTVLADDTATRAAVLDALPDHPAVHLACHGLQDPDDPSASRLALHDGDLTLLDVVRAQRAPAELAVLSACQTARGDAELADEAIHLAAAFQLIGYRNVIGTLWNMRDAAAPDLARVVHRAVAANPTADTATALHEAVTELRRNPAFASPAVWAPYVHFGPGR
ncbi:MAG TPA: CHAT domain-containing protein, partial [Pseudonocardiaceae bacterium]|nr:CHAT domain-containing protein [Pseudonocardiaceae bacterium]